MGAAQVEKGFQVAVFFRFGSRIIYPGQTEPLAGRKMLYVADDTVYVLPPEPYKTGMQLAEGETTLGPWILFPLIRPRYTRLASSEETPTEEKI